MIFDFMLGKVSAKTTSNSRKTWLVPLFCCLGFLRDICFLKTNRSKSKVARTEPGNLWENRMCRIHGDIDRPFIVPPMDLAMLNMVLMFVVQSGTLTI